MIEIEHENLFRYAVVNGINLFLGAGFSVLAKAGEKNLPVGDALKEELLDYFKRNKPSALNLSQLCQIIASTERNNLHNFFYSRFTVTDFPTEYKNLENLTIKAIFTTNIDDLVPKIFAYSEKYYINDILLRGPAIAGNRAIDYIPLHGNVAHGDEGYDFSPLEIASSFERDRDKWSGYTDRIQNTPTLYWGYRLEDAGVLQSLAKSSLAGKKRAESWIVLRSKDVEAIEYYASLGFQIIIADTNDLLKYVGELDLKQANAAVNTLLGKQFPEYKIPAISTVPVRSLRDFYLGAEPTWYDIFSGKIYETSHFGEIKNAIAGKKNVVLIGGAVTGKSTLLKQLATQLTGFGTTLYIEDITPEKAALLNRQIQKEGQSVIAFIDNAADASEAIQMLVNNSHIKIVASERDYIFDSVAHRFPSAKFLVKDISSLSAVDIQAIENHIPNDINHHAYIRPTDSLNSAVEPTFFEVISSTITDSSLADRFLDALKKYRKSNFIEHDILVAACYCYASHIPISIDIATAFCHPQNLNVLQVMKAMESMGSMLSQYEGTMAEQNQSYYVPRSRQVSEVVLQKIPVVDLRRVLEIFHSEVSTTKIGKYDVFKRNAYDARLIGRAFPNWKDGLLFYERAFVRDFSY